MVDKRIKHIRDWVRINGDMSEDGKNITYDCKELENIITEALNISSVCPKCKQEFKINQRVMKFDNNDNILVYGTIINVGNHSIEIAWDDIEETCTHEKDEWDSIIIT